jgi:hypothetical protein
LAGETVQTAHKSRKDPYTGAKLVTSNPTVSE